MPRFDRTGPMGYGPMTGRGFGYCGDNHGRRPGWGPRRGWGPNRGMRRFFGGRRPPPPPPPPTKEEEKEFLTQYKADLEAEIKEVEKELQRLA